MGLKLQFYIYISLLFLLLLLLISNPVLNIFELHRLVEVQCFDTNQKIAKQKRAHK